MQLRVFLSDLKRRQVYRAIIVYATIAWVLLEGADIVFPRLGFADDSITLVLILVCIGFPITVYLALVYDITPDGIFRTPPLSPGTRYHFSWGRIFEFVLIGGLIITVAYLYTDRLSLQQRVAEPGSEVVSKTQDIDPSQYRSIAVLPFADMSESGDQAWFAEGIAEELLLALSKVEPLSVVARTSSFAFKDTDKTVADIADILNVQAVLEGSVRRSGKLVRVTAQLIDARSGYHIWSGSYQHQLTDIFALQDQLAKSVVEALSIELGVSSTVPLIAEQTRIPEAYDWFMRGRALFDWGAAQNTFKSIRYFEKAIETDPDYATAWGYLSYAYVILMIYRPFAEVGPASIAAHEKALSLDPQQEDALAAKAIVTQLLEHDLQAVGRLYQRLIESHKNSQAIRRIYSLFFLQFVDRQSRAISLFSDIVELDPLHAGRKSTLAGMFYFAGDFEAAVREAEKALQLDPQHFLGLSYLIAAYVETNNYVALDSLLAGIPLALREQPEIKALIGFSDARRGNDERARKTYLELAESIDSMTPLAMFNMASLAFVLDEIEEGIDLLERLEKSGSWLQFWSKLILPVHESFRSHPRYKALLKLMGLDDESIAELHRRMSFD